MGGEGREGGRKGGRERGISGLTPQAQADWQKRPLKGGVALVYATIAMGMGIDKPGLTLYILDSKPVD